MKTVLIDYWHDKAYPNHVQFLSSILTDRVFPLNNTEPPTHFIEVYKNSLGKCGNKQAIEFGQLRRYLGMTKRYGGKTIAIFKIRFKTQPNDPSTIQAD